MPIHPVYTTIKVYTIYEEFLYLEREGVLKIFTKNSEWYELYTCKQSK